MPWRKVKGGYAAPGGGVIKRPRQYEALRRKGVPKATAAKIANSKGTRRK